MSTRRTLLVFGGAAAVIFAVQKGIPAIYDRLAQLEFAPIPGAPGFRQLSSVNGQTTVSGFDPLVGLSTATPIAQSKLPEDLKSSVFPSLTGGLPIAIFTDYNCPNCRVLEQRLDAAIVGRDVSIDIHHLPLLGPYSVEAARVALAAGQQGKETEAHQILSKSREVITPSRITRLASQLQIDSAQLTRDISHPTVDVHLNRAAALAERFGILGTPGLIIGQTFVLGVVSRTILDRLIEIETAEMTA